MVGRCWACPMWPMWAMWAYQHCPALHYHPAKQTTISGKPGPKWSYRDGYHELMILPKFPPTLGLVVGCRKTWSNAQDLRGRRPVLGPAMACPALPELLSHPFLQRSTSRTQSRAHRRAQRTLCTELRAFSCFSDQGG